VNPPASLESLEKKQYLVPAGIQTVLSNLKPSHNTDCTILAPVTALSEITISYSVFLVVLCVRLYLQYNSFTSTHRTRQVPDYQIFWIIRQHL